MVCNLPHGAVQCGTPWCFVKAIPSDVCLEAEASPRGSLEAENLLPRPRLDVLMPRLGLASPRD